MNATDRAIAVLSALATPLVTLLVVYGAATPDQGAAIGGVLAALAVGWHAAQQITTRTATAAQLPVPAAVAVPPQPPTATTPPVPVVAAAAAPPAVSLPAGAPDPAATSTP